ncbi:HD-GYP domain-containing protein [Marinobacter salinisoli]|uniref:HD-GYP domain-containing protein n=1 Tax=Marinobacter salinisoli TaxID=2769486 RepID=A0ABX7MTW4_9GAMM|nr:HD-GYP domain-containing protein [Marinobacter salinisoli]QSP95781.1 HD-GYP domain-containing protein [Marinobacter salinisoli]
MHTAHQETIEKRIHVSELSLGMHVVRLDKPWEETDFLIQGFVIRDESELEALRLQCSYVFIEGRLEAEPAPARRQPQQPASAPRKGLFRGRPAGRSDKSARAQPVRRRVNYMNKIDSATEMKTAVVKFKDAQQTAKSIMSGLRLGRTLDLNNARAVVDSCVDSVLRNENALLLLTKIKNQDEYTAEHCLNVAILCAAFGKHLGLLEEEIRNLSLCGMLHDVGKTRIPNEILNKPGALTPSEFEIMREHTTHGRNILMSTSRSLTMAVDVAFNHHERIDGQGYPRGLQAQQIPFFAKIVGLVDTYDAITSNRIYDKGRASMHALDIIHKHRGTQFDEELAVAFIQLIGVYPPGSIVELMNGEVGIVVENQKQHKLKPKVLLVRESDKTPLPSFRTVDLMLGPKDASGEVYKIAREVPDGTHGVVLKDFVEQGLIFSKPAPIIP